LPVTGAVLAPWLAGLGVLLVALGTTACVVARRRRST
jgi:hypothetical protein